MSSHKMNVYWSLSIVAPFAVLSATFFMLQATFFGSASAHMHAYQWCFVSFGIIALCIEMRVRMGYRLKRGIIFWIHLPVALLFFVTLGALATTQLPRWVELFAFKLFLIVLVTGAILFYQGLSQTFRSVRQSPLAVSETKE